MAIQPKCPGQDKRSLSADLITCLGCGYKVEVFSDEVARRCPECRNLVSRNRLPACLDWCKYAKECTGR